MPCSFDTLQSIVQLAAWLHMVQLDYRSPLSLYASKSLSELLRFLDRFGLDLLLSGAFHYRCLLDYHLLCFL